MAEYLLRLEPITKVSYKDYSSNYFTKHTTERLIELIVEAAVDINGIIIVGKGNPPPGDYYSSFMKMTEMGIFGKPFARRVANTSGLRNRLAHEYEDVDDRIVWYGLKSFMIIYKRYIEAINNYINR